MQLHDEAISYEYHGLLVPPAEEWAPTAELRSRHFLNPTRLKELIPRLVQVRGQVASERDLDPKQVPPEMKPLDAGFIDLPQKMLDQYRQKGQASELGRILAHAARLCEQSGRVIFLGIGGSYLGACASSRPSAVLIIMNCRRNHASACPASASRATTSTMMPCKT